MIKLFLRGEEKERVAFFIAKIIPGFTRPNTDLILVAATGCFVEMGAEENKCIPGPWNVVCSGPGTRFRLETSMLTWGCVSQGGS